MKIKEEKRGDVLVLFFSGELMGGEETKAFQERIYQAIQQGMVSIAIDMKDVKWMNSSGLGMLMAGLTTLRGSGGDLKLANASERVRRPIEIAKLNKILQIFGSVNEAVESFASGG